MTSIGLPTLLLALAWTSPARAMPLYDAPDSALSPDTCKPMIDSGDGVWDEFGVLIEDRVHVYLAQDFAAEYTSGTDNDLTQHQARQALLDGMEVWNRESRGPVYVYEGQSKIGLVKNSLLTATCEDFALTGGPDGEPIQTPAILVAGWEQSESLAGVWTVRGSDGEDCHVFGFDGFVGLNVQRPALDLLEPVLIHELGHGLGLEHSFGTDSTTPNTPMSVMQYPDGVKAYNANTKEGSVGDSKDRQGWRNHLWPYDIDCVDDALDIGASEQDGRVRQLVPRWRAFHPTDAKWGEATWATWTWISKAATAAGGLEPESAKGIVYPMVTVDSTGDEPTLRWADDSIDTGPAADGDLLMVDGSAPIEATDVAYAPIAPLLWTPYEADLTSMDDLVMAWPEVPREGGPPDAATVSEMDPPLVRSVIGGFLGETAEDGPLWTMTVGGGPIAQVGTHIGLRAAWNPQTAQTLYATVLTRDCARDDEPRVAGRTLYARTEDGAVDRCGGIRLHQGQGPSLVGGELLGEPRTIVSEASTDPGTVLVELPEYTRPIGSSDYEYSGSTDVAPAIACAPKVLDAGGDANCILAWVDSGTPDHHVLVSRFSGDGTEIALGKAYLLRPETMRVVDGDGEETVIKEPGITTSASDLSAAWVDGRFVLALKGSDFGHEDTVQVVQTAAGQIDRWEEWTVFADDHTVDAPSLRFDPLDQQAELGLIWTTLD